MQCNGQHPNHKYYVKLWWNLIKKTPENKYFGFAIGQKSFSNKRVEFTNAKY